MLESFGNGVNRHSAGSGSNERAELVSHNPQVSIGLNAVIVAVTDEIPRVLTVKAPPAAREKSRPSSEEAPDRTLPFGTLDPAHDRTLALCLRRWVKKQSGLELGYVEQLYTYGDRFRDERERSSGARIISVAYLALVRERAVAGSGEASWWDCYQSLPWEDWRSGKPEIIEKSIEPALDSWVESSRSKKTFAQRRERVDITFGLRGAPWDPDRVLERFELLYEARHVYEFFQDKASPPRRTASPPLVGYPMALDHRRILATALGRIRGKLKYRPVVFELLPPTFTLLQLQRVVEALVGVRLHKQNFRRLLEKGGLVEGTGLLDPATGGRPAELFRFRREVLRERPAPGVGIPGLQRRSGI